MKFNLTKENLHLFNTIGTVFFEDGEKKAYFLSAYIEKVEGEDVYEITTTGKLPNPLKPTI